MKEESCIKVAVRTRLRTAREIIDPCGICTHVNPEKRQITLSNNKLFTFDYVFDLNAHQETVYNTCAAPLIKRALEGYNATIIAYGQTGSGKTYTMGSGFDAETDSERIGIIPRAIQQLFDGIQSMIKDALLRGKPPSRFKIYVQFLEFYKEDFIDLLDTGKDCRATSMSKAKSGIRIHKDAKQSICVSGVTSKVVCSGKEALECLRQGALSRSTASTRMNSQSSRSHAVFTLIIEQERVVQLEDSKVDGIVGLEIDQEYEVLSSKFHFVDLAGSERMKRTGASGDHINEGIAINRGLLALSNVISALGSKSKKVSHVPYRNSKLTRLLQDSLGGNSHTVMIACISPSDKDFMETLETLNYANKARNIQNKVNVNQNRPRSSRSSLMLRQEVQQLRMQLQEYKRDKPNATQNDCEGVNVLYLENVTASNDVANLQVKLKLMQETIDALTAKNLQLLREKADGVLVNSNKEAPISGVDQEYLTEVEELRGKLLESEYLHSRVRKRSKRQSYPIVRKRKSCGSVGVRCPDIGSENSVQDFFDVANRNVEKNKKILLKFNRSQSHIPDNYDSFPSEEEESETDARNEDQNGDRYNPLRAAISEMKETKLKLIKKMKEESKKSKEIRQLREETRRTENIIRSLEDVELRRKQEVSAMKRAARTSRRSTRIETRQCAEFIPKLSTSNEILEPAKQKWQILEKIIVDNTFNRRSIIFLEQELERLMEKRKTLHAALQIKSQELVESLANESNNTSLIHNIKLEIEQSRSDLDYYNNSIQEVQQNIIDIEDAKVSFESSEFVADLSISEMSYIVEKLYNIILYYSSQVALKEVNCKELETTLKEIQNERRIEQQLLTHLLKVKNTDFDEKISNEIEHEQASELSNSSKSSSSLLFPNTSSDISMADISVYKNPDLAQVNWNCKVVLRRMSSVISAENFKDENEIDTPKCKRANRRRQTNHAHDETDFDPSSKFNCAECGRDFNFKSSLKGHIINVHGCNKKVKCPICHRRLLTASLKKHMNTVHKSM